MTRHTVLLIDDDARLLRGLVRAMNDEPFELITTTQPGEAMAMAETRRVDAVVCDHEMPQMKGTQLLRWFHENHPDTVRLMLTGNATLDVAVEAINGGAIHRFFTKPCDPVDLGHTLRQTLEQRDLVRLARALHKSHEAKNDLLAALEERQPGITEVVRDESGAVVLDDDVDGEVDRLFDELNHLF